MELQCPFFAFSSLFLSPVVKCLFTEHNSSGWNLHMQHNDLEQWLALLPLFSHFTCLWILEPKGFVELWCLELCFCYGSQLLGEKAEWCQNTKKKYKCCMLILGNPSGSNLLFRNWPELLGQVDFFLLFGLCYGLAVQSIPTLRLHLFTSLLIKSAGQTCLFLNVRGLQLPKPVCVCVYMYECLCV